MARCLIVGCGCRGRGLAAQLIARGYSVRGTTRDRQRAHEIEAVGAEAIVADPDRIATVTGALEQVSVVCLLLGSAVGDPRALATLHGTRLEMLLARILDGPVRGVVYEAAGTAPPDMLLAGGETVASFCMQSRIGYALLRHDPADPEAWLGAALDAVEQVLRPR